MSVHTAMAIASVMRSGNVVWDIEEGSALISRVRSRMATKFLKTGAEVLVFIDDDIHFDVGGFWKIVNGARKTRSICGGIYATRGSKASLAVRFLNGNDTIRPRSDGALAEITYLSGGFMAIHREVLEAVQGSVFSDADGSHCLHYCDEKGDRPFWNFFGPFVVNTSDGGFEYLSEDWAFCERARQSGFKVWAETSVWLGHEGSKVVTPADVQNPVSGVALAAIGGPNG